MIYELKRTQILHVDRKKAWEFLSNPQNLKLITPPYLGFEVISELPAKMYAGQLIQYYVTPVLGIKVNWVTEITHVEEGKYFVDEQRIGPYSLWHHQHFIDDCDSGVEMTDIVHYKLPFGILGRLAHPILVKNKLNEIFEFRYNTLESIFNK